MAAAVLLLVRIAVGGRAALLGSAEETKSSAGHYRTLSDIIGQTGRRRPDSGRLSLCKLCSACTVAVQTFIFPPPTVSFPCWETVGEPGEEEGGRARTDMRRVAPMSSF